MQNSKKQQGEIRKPSSSDQGKETEKNNRMGKTRDLKKIQATKGIFHAKMGKGQKWYGLNRSRRY